jgi:hypothetical protein
MLGRGLEIYKQPETLAGFVGLLDQPFAIGATAAYSLRLLREKHSGGLVRVRADDSGTDKGEADVLPRLQPDGSKIIELNSPIENLNSEAQNRLGVPQGGGDKVLADLVDAGGQNFDGFVSKWYDQSANNNDATQSGASKQPQIVSSGSVIQENAKPAIEYNDDLLTANVAASQNENLMLLLVIKVTEGINSNPRMAALVGNAVNFQVGYNEDNRYFIRRNNETDSTNNNFSDILGKQYLLTYGTSNGNDFFTRNSNSKSFTFTGKPSSNSKLSNGFYILKGYEKNSYYVEKGTIQEVILYTSDKTADQNNIESNINNNYSIF